MRLLMLLILSFLSLSARVLADALPSNLKGLEVTDFCGLPNVQVTINGIDDNLIAAQLNGVVKDQDILFDSKFNEMGKGCKIFSSINFQSIEVKNNSGLSIGYAYSYRFSVWGFQGNVLTDRGISNVLIPIIYDTTGIGVVGNRADLISQLNIITKNMFQDFLLNWRKSRLP